MGGAAAKQLRAVIEDHPIRGLSPRFSRAILNVCLLLSSLYLSLTQMLVGKIAVVNMGDLAEGLFDGGML